MMVGLISLDSNVEKNTFNDICIDVLRWRQHARQVGMRVFPLTQAYLIGLKRNDTDTFMSRVSSLGISYMAFFENSRFKNH